MLQSTSEKNDMSTGINSRLARIEPLTVSVPEAAQLIGICSKRVYELAATPDFPAARIGKNIRIPVDGLREWINRQAAKPR